MRNNFKETCQSNQILARMVTYLISNILTGLTIKQFVTQSGIDKCYIYSYLNMIASLSIGNWLRDELMITMWKLPISHWRAGTLKCVSGHGHFTFLGINDDKNEW